MSELLGLDMENDVKRKGPISEIIRRLGLLEKFERLVRTGAFGASLVAETNDDDIFRCNSPGGVSAFAGTIATLPGGAVLTYNVTSGQELALVPNATTQLAKLTLYNTTRGTSALILNSVAATNTITLTDTVPAGWVVGDVITIASQTVSGGGLNWTDIELTSGPVGRSILFITTTIISATPGDVFYTHPFETYADSKLKSMSAQVANLNNNGLQLMKINSDKFSIAWVGTPTRVQIREQGYV